MRRKEMLRPKQPEGPNGLIPTTVKRIIDKKKRELAPLAANDKLLCALRKVLVKMSHEDEDGSRFFISGDKMKLVTPPMEVVGKEGEAQNYSGEGYAKIGVSLKSGGVNYRYVNFTINFRDAKNELGLPDVEFFDPTSITDVGSRHPEVADL